MELLVVVAIIGILATAGVPQYRRMVQKSKKSEAKVFLGDIANAEAAFFSEFGTYGNNLRRMGVEMDNGNQRIYIAGLTNANCSGVAGPFPTAGSTWGTQVSAQNPAYYPVVAGDAIFGRLGRAAAGNCANSMAAAVVLGGNNYAPIADGSAVYKASASGQIQSGANLDTDAGAVPAGTSDQWMINEQRALVNNTDGIN